MKKLDYKRNPTRFFSNLNKAKTAMRELANTEQRTVYINQVLYGPHLTPEYSLRLNRDVLDPSAPNIIDSYTPKSLQ